MLATTNVVKQSTYPKQFSHVCVVRRTWSRKAKKLVSYNENRILIQYGYICTSFKNWLAFSTLLVVQNFYYRRVAQVCLDFPIKFFKVLNMVMGTWRMKMQKMFSVLGMNNKRANIFCLSKYSVPILNFPFFKVKIQILSKFFRH